MPTKTKQTRKPASKPSLLLIPVGNIASHPDNPRKRFDEQDLQDLADSIREHGLIEPLVVRPNPATDTPYQLVVGERRLRAARIAALPNVPCLLRDVDDLKALELMAIENLQRKDLHPLEEAAGFSTLRDKAGYSVQDLAGKIGKSKEHVYARLKLLDLSEDWQKLLLEGELTASHGVLIARLLPAQQAALHQEWTDGSYYEDLATLSTRNLQECITDRFLGSLVDAPFPIDDPKLLPAAGDCTVCLKNTGCDLTGSLLGVDTDKRPEPEQGECTDLDCWKAKAEAHETRLAEKIRKDARVDSVPLVSSKHYSQREGVLTSRHVAIVPKSTKNARPALQVEGGKVQQVWIVDCEDPGVSTGRPPSDGAQQFDSAPRARRLEELRLYRAENLARRRIFEACRAAIEDPMRNDYVGLLGGSAARSLIAKVLVDSRPNLPSRAKERGPDAQALAAAFLGGYGCPHIWTSLGKPDPDSLVLIPPDRSRLFAELALEAVAADEVCFHELHRPAPYGLLAFATALGVDVGAIRKQADWDTLSKKRQKERAEAESPARKYKRKEAPAERGDGSDSGHAGASDAGKAPPSELPPGPSPSAGGAAPDPAPGSSCAADPAQEPQDEERGDAEAPSENGARAVLEAPKGDRKTAHRDPPAPTISVADTMSVDSNEPQTPSPVTLQADSYCAYANVGRPSYMALVVKIKGGVRCDIYYVDAPPKGAFLANLPDGRALHVRKVDSKAAQNEEDAFRWADDRVCEIRSS